MGFTATLVQFSTFYMLMSFDLGSDAHIVNRQLGKMQLFLSDHLRRPSSTRKENKSSLDWSGPEVLEVCTFDDCRLVLSNPKSTFRWNCEPVHEAMSRNKSHEGHVGPNSGPKFRSRSLPQIWAFYQPTCRSQCYFIQGQVFSQTSRLLQYWRKPKSWMENAFSNM